MGYIHLKTQHRMRWFLALYCSFIGTGQVIPNTWCRNSFDCYFLDVRCQWSNTQGILEPCACESGQCVIKGAPPADFCKIDYDCYGYHKCIGPGYKLMCNCISNTCQLSKYIG